MSDDFDRMVFDDAIHIQPCCGRCGSREHQHRRDDRSDYRPRTMLHSIAKAVTRLCVSQSIDVRKLIAGW